MDKVFSTRLDEDLIRQVNRFAKERSISKKGLIEKALRTYFNHVSSNIEFDILEQSFGMWEREETPHDTWSHAR